MSTKTFFLLPICTLLLFLNSCNMIDYHPYDVRIDGETGLTAKNIALIEEQCAGKDTLYIVQISDTQRWYDETEDLVLAINKLPNVDFVIHTGDQADFGTAKEFEWMRSILSRLKVPFVCAIGNHDCIGTGEASYRVMYGEDNFSFNASFLHVTVLNTNAYEYDYSDDIPDFTFLKNDIASLPDSVTKSIIAMHVAPGMYQFNDNVDEYFNYYTKQYPGLQFCMCGHYHRYDVLEPFGDEGPLYYECPAAEDKQFILYTIIKDSDTYEAQLVSI